MSESQYATWSGHNVFSIKMIGTASWILERILTLVEDFNEPKFGYGGELWDEDDEPGVFLD